MDESEDLALEILYTILSYLTVKEVIQRLPVSKDFLAVGFKLLGNKAVQGNVTAKHYLLNYLKTGYTSPYFLQQVDSNHFNLFLTSLLNNPKNKEETLIARTIQLHLALQNKLLLSLEVMNAALLQLKRFCLESKTHFPALWAFSLLFQGNKAQLNALFTQTNQSLECHLKSGKPLSVFLKHLIQSINPKEDWYGSVNKVRALSYFLPKLSTKQKKDLLDVLIPSLFSKYFVRSYLRQDSPFQFVIALCIRQIVTTLKAATSVGYQRNLITRFIKKARISNYNELYSYHIKDMLPLILFCAKNSTREERQKLFSVIMPSARVMKNKHRKHSMISFMVTAALTYYRFGYTEEAEKMGLQLTPLIPELLTLFEEDINRILLNELQELGYFIDNPNSKCAKLYQAIQEIYPYLLEKMGAVETTGKAPLLLAPAQNNNSKEYQKVLEELFAVNPISLFHIQPTQRAEPSGELFVTLQRKPAPYHQYKFYANKELGKANAPQQQKTTSRSEIIAFIHALQGVNEPQRSERLKAYLPIIAKDNNLIRHLITTCIALIPEEERDTFVLSQIDKLSVTKLSNLKPLIALFPDKQKQYCEKLLALSPKLVNHIFFFKEDSIRTIARYAHLLDSAQLDVFANQLYYFLGNSSPYYGDILANIAQEPVFDLLLTRYPALFLKLYDQSDFLRFKILGLFITNYPLFSRKIQNKILQVIEPIQPQDNASFTPYTSEITAESKVNYFKNILPAVNALQIPASQLMQNLTCWMQGEPEPLLRFIKTNRIACIEEVASDDSIYQSLVFCEAVAAEFFNLPKIQQKNKWIAEEWEWGIAYFTLPLFRNDLLKPQAFEEALIKAILPYTNPFGLTALQEKMRPALQQFVKDSLFERNAAVTPILLKHMNLLTALFKVADVKTLVLHLLEETLLEDNEQDVLWHKRSIGRLKTLLETQDENALMHFFNSSNGCYRFRPISPFEHFMQKIRDIPRNDLIGSYDFSENIIDLRNIAQGI
ncbi:MAG: hypothetical protein WC785_02670 [Tatlockia sp.]|jgi:hypothetical protein